MYYAAFSLQMPPLNASIPLRGMYCSDCPCIRVGEIVLSLLSQETHSQKSLQFPYFYSSQSLCKTLPPNCLGSPQINAFSDFSIDFVLVLFTGSYGRYLYSDLFFMFPSSLRKSCRFLPSSGNGRAVPPPFSFEPDSVWG